MVRMIVRGVPDRIEYINYLKRVLPEAEFCIDKRYEDKTMSPKIKCALNFLDALMMAPNEPCIHMEEDIIITEDFLDKINYEISKRPNEVIQFFSMRKKDIEVGSRYDNNFIAALCFYVPAGYGKEMAEFYWKWDKLHIMPSGFDIMICDWLNKRKEKYWIHIPSLVEHRVSKSVIDSRRSSKRQSKTFVNPVL